MLSPTGFLKNSSLRAGLCLPWCHYLQFLDVISVRLIYLSQNGRVYWKRVPQKEFICVFAVWAVACVFILPAVKWWCLCPTGDSLQTIPPAQQMLCSARECKGVIFLPSWFLLVRILWPFPSPAPDLNLILLFFPFALLFWVLPMSQNNLSLIPLNTMFSWVCLLCLPLPALSSRQKWNTGGAGTLKAGSGFSTHSLRSDGFQASPLGSSNSGAFIS